MILDANADRTGQLWLATHALVLGWGVVALVLRCRLWIARVSLVLLSFVVLGGLAGEILLRVGIAIGVERLRDPGLYAGWHHDEEHWRLRHAWKKGQPITDAGFVTHPLFGWVTPASLALPAQAGVSGGEVLIYGDSFTQGVAPVRPEKRLPRVLDALLPARAVHDYAVSGYGVDQIYLRMRESRDAYKSPIIVVGILTLDLDRALFAVRDAPKPRLRVAGNELRLENVPLPEDPEDWYAAHPIGIRSYLWALIQRRLVLIASNFSETESPYRRAEKEELARRILEEMVERTRESQAPLLFALFYGQWEFGYEGWRERFIKQEAARLGVPLVDSKPVFREYAEANGLALSDLYFPAPNGHPNALGNRIMAEAIASRIRELEAPKAARREGMPSRSRPEETSIP